MAKVIALLVLVGGGLLLRALMFSDSTMGLIGGGVLAIGMVLLIVALRKI
jgi:hypothetical protein